MSTETLSLETLAFFRDLLGQVNLNAGHPDFEQAVAVTTKARRELDAAIAAAAPPPPNRAQRRAKKSG